jgi:hypothetical protein
LSASTYSCQPYIFLSSIHIPVSLYCTYIFLSAPKYSWKPLHIPCSLFIFLAITTYSW